MKIRNMSCDLETYSSVNLAKAGVYRYAESSDFEILLFAYSADGGPVQQVDLANGEHLPAEIIAALEDDSVTKWAYNAAFERICLSRFLGYPTGQYLNTQSWRCSMVWAATMGLPLSLEGVGAVLGLEKQKLIEGRELIRYFCQPCAPTKANGQRTRNLPAHALDRWLAFKKYNIRDVETETSIQARLSNYAKSKGCAWGTMDTLPEIPGVALRFDGHVGVYVGNGYAVEERGFNYGCVKTKVSSRKWTHWYQLPFVDYGDAVFTGGSGVKEDAPASEYTLGTRMLRKGSRGTDVKAMQEFLLQLGFVLPKYGADGEFGTETEAALKKFQAKASIQQDGAYGSETHKALMDAVADNDAGKEPEQPNKPKQPGEPTQPDVPDTPTTKRVHIVCDSGSVNIRVGNGTQYERITAVPNGTSLERVATAENGWHAVVVNGCVGWVSGKYSELV